MTPASSKPCPCTSGLPYRDCCGPYHLGVAEAPDAEALMRSRYGAYAARCYDYLYRTLHPEHEDRLRPREEVLRAITRACQVSRYMGLRILDRRLPPSGGSSQPSDEAAYVLFLARVFQRGADCSFVERSEFRRAEGGWRYLRGDLRPLSALAAGAASLTLADFARLAPGPTE